MTSHVDSELVDDPDFDKKFDEDAADEVFQNRIAPKCLSGPSIAHPTFVIVAGESGVGKTAAIGDVRTLLAGPTQEIVPDKFVLDYPDYPALAARDQKRAQETVADFIGHCTEKMTELTFEKGVNSAKEFSFPSGMETDLEAAREYGYKSALYLKVAQGEVSFTSLQVRTLSSQETGNVENFIVSDGSHSQGYAAWPRAIFDAERNMQFDSIYVARRDGSRAYENHLTTDSYGRKAWLNPPMGFEAVMLERLRAITPQIEDELKNAWVALPRNQHLSATRTPYDIPLVSHADRITAFASSEGSKFDPFTPGSHSPLASEQWLGRLNSELEIVRTSRGNMGVSEEFDRHTFNFQAAMSDLATQRSPIIEINHGGREAVASRVMAQTVMAEPVTMARESRCPLRQRDRSEERQLGR